MIQKFDVSTGEEMLHGVGFPGIVPVIGDQSLPIRNLGPDLGENTERNPGRAPGHGRRRDQCGHRPRGGTAGMSLKLSLAATLGSASCAT